MAFKPFEYPECVKYKNAIQHSYWLVSEWNFISDKHDFKVVLDDKNRNAIKNTMLAISQVEVAVKKFWAKLGNRFPKAEFEQVGAVFSESECFDDQTEVLTKNGWSKFPDLLDNDLVAQYDKNTNQITFSKPLKKIVRKYQGKMHHYFSDGTDLMVTPNHEILIKHPSHDKYTKKRSCEGKWGRNYRYPTSGYAVCENPYLFGDIDRLLVAIQADGSFYGTTPSGKGRRDVCFLLKKERKINRLSEILNRLKIQFKITNKEDGGKVFNFHLPDYLVVDIFKVKSFDYIDITRVDSEFGKKFLSELCEWDSTHYNNSGLGFMYYNTNESAINKVQAIAALSGYSTNKGINRTAEEIKNSLTPKGFIRKSAKTCYNLGLIPSDMATYPYRTEIMYDGMVYCLTMPSGCLVTRRGKRVAISGNCRHADAYSHLLDVLELNNDFDKLFSLPVIKDRISYLSDTLLNIDYCTHEEYILNLALFSIFVENVSLFSQFLIIKSFNKYQNILKDIENVVQSTQKEEICHAMFGVYLINTIKEQNLSWFNDSFKNKIYSACDKALESELNLIDWIFEKGEIEILPTNQIKEFIKNRFNESLQLINLDPIYKIDKELVSKSKWFDDEIYSQVNVDFFYKKPVTYSKKVQPITAGDLF